MSRTFVVGLGIAVALAACGGKNKSSDTGPDNGGGGGGGGDDTAENPCGDSTGMCSPETLQEIQSDLDRKRDPATRCLTNAIDGGDVDKNAHGSIAVDFVITPDGHAKNVTITKSTIDAQSVQDCVKKLVENISFPSVPKDLDWSYTFAFEAF
jgi:hypothetical protein